MPRFKILVIDDDPDVLDLVGDLLGAAGYEVRRASRGPQGIELARQESPHLTLLDLDMPGMPGTAAVQAMKQDPAIRTIPVVALTGAFSVDADQLIRAGCIGYIPKPFDPESFASLIAGFVRATSGRPRPGPGERPPGTSGRPGSPR